MLRFNLNQISWSLVAFLVMSQVSLYAINGTVSHVVTHEAAGDYFTSVALLYFLANISSFGAQYVLNKYIPLLKVYYDESFWYNLKQMLRFFAVLFIIVLIITSLLDLVFFQIHGFHNLEWEQSYYHPSELFLFLIFFITVHNYFFHLFYAYDLERTSYCISTLGTLCQIFVFYICYKNNSYLSLSANPSENLVFNYILIFSLRYFIAMLGMIAYFYLVFVPTIASKNKAVTNEDWRYEIKYFIFNAIQYDWIILCVIIIEAMSDVEKDPTVFALLFTIVSLVHITERATKQAHVGRLGKFITLHEYTKAARYIKNIVLITGGGLLLFNLIVGLASTHLLQYFKIPGYRWQLFALLIAESYSATFSSLFSTFLMVYKRESLKYLTYYTTAIYTIFIIGGIMCSSLYGLNGMVSVFFICSIISTTIKIIMFRIYFPRFMRKE